LNPVLQCAHGQKTATAVQFGMGKQNGRDRGCDRDRGAIGAANAQEHRSLRPDC